MTGPSTLDGVLRADGDERAVRFEREYPTGADDLWRAVTEPERLARWLDPVSGDLRPGGQVVVHFDDGDATFDVVRCEPPRELQVRWRHEGGASVVTVRVERLGDARARLVLDHARLAAPAAPAYSAGWHWHLDALSAVVRDEPAPVWDGVFDVLHAGYAERAGALA